MSLFKKKSTEQNSKHFAVCGIVEKDDKILLVRHTYGTAKDRILLPGGYVKEGEIPTIAIEREILEETSVVCKAKELHSMQFKAEQWCAIFTMDYISGEPKSDGYENSEVLLLSVEDALLCDDLTNMSREILKTELYLQFEPFVFRFAGIFVFKTLDISRVFFILYRFFKCYTNVKTV